MGIPDIIYQARSTVHELVLARWLAEQVFSPRWWGMMALIAISYLICFKLFDKRRLRDLFLFGSLICVALAVYEDIGVNFLLWFCTLPAFPIVPCLFVPYLTIVPVFYMLIFQYTPTWRQFSLWNLIAASILTLVLQPILVYLQILELNNWKTVYGLPFFFTITSLARYVTLLIISIEQRQEELSRNFSPSATLHQPAMKPADIPNKKKD